ncbi:helix-turn-helix domain-containing protein [Enterococcus sp. LJL128]
MEFGEILKALRKKKRLTQKELADILFLEQTTISSYENGKIQPTAKTINDIANFFDVSSDYLLGRPDKRKNKLEQVIDSTFDELKSEDTLLFLKDKNGDIDEETARLVKIAMKNAMRTVDDMKKKE